jgi:hypothetical protein
MHVHDHVGPQSDSLRPKSRLDPERDDATVFRAAAAGRTDVLGADGMLRLQRAVGNEAVQRLAEDENPAAVVAKGGGTAFGGPVRDDMESRFGTDFSDVRIHTGSDAHASAKAVNAHAYTVGSDIVFQRGAYDPESVAGRTMLAHELTHVVQQRSGPVDGDATGHGFKVSDPGDRFEREAAANADRIVGMPSPHVAGPDASGPVAGGGAAIQRAEEEEEPVQGCFEHGAAPAVQRQDEEEEPASE